MGWFAVRTIYRTRIVSRGRQYTERDAEPVAIEDRIVLFLAKDGKQAIRRAIKEAQQYARTASSLNEEGRRVVTSYVGLADCYESFDAPADMAELYSSVEIASAAENKKAILERKLGHPMDPTTARKLMAGWITGELDKKLGSRWATRKSTTKKGRRTRTR